MNKADISLLLTYNFWANERILAACDGVSTEAFTRAVTPDPGWGSLRGILVHALDAEYGWRCVLQAQDADEILDVADFADVATLKTRWAAERAAWLEYEASLSEASLNAGYGENPNAGPRVWQIILHVINHGTQHRSEAAALLTGYGHSPGEYDLGVFLHEKAE